MLTFAGPAVSDGTTPVPVPAADTADLPTGGSSYTVKISFRTTCKEYAAPKSTKVFGALWFWGEMGTLNCCNAFYIGNHDCGQFWWGNDLKFGQDGRAVKRITDGEWHHVVCVYDQHVQGANNHVIYLDGVQVATRKASTPPSIPAKKGTFLLGTCANHGIFDMIGVKQRGFKGEIKDLEVYDRAFSALDLGMKGSTACPRCHQETCAMFTKHATNADSIVDALERLAVQKQQGKLDERNFRAAKATLLKEWATRAGVIL